MKRKTLISLMAMAFLSMGTMPSMAENAKPFVIPELSSWQGAEGQFRPSGRVIVNSRQLAAVAESFIQDYEEMFGVRLQVVKGKPAAGDFVFVQDNTADASSQMGEEGYRLNIEDYATVTAATPRGAYWATRTILQISEQSASRTLPRGATTDVPAYAVRGFMMDCGRKYIPLDYMSKLVKVMAYYKMNTLQVHLNDNGFRQYFGNEWAKTPAAFRMESEWFPGLTATDGSYSKRDFINFQVDAEKQYVDIVPEIDVPAHSLAFTRFRPSLGSQEFGEDHLNLRNPEVVPFLDSLFTEYCAGPDPVFRGKYVHIGTDEYSNRDPKVVEMFRDLTDHLIRKVESYGKQAYVWGSLTHAKGETPVKVDDVIMQMWSCGYADPSAMKELGYKLVSIPDGYVYIVPAAGYYYDYLNCGWLYQSYTPAQMGCVKFEERDPQVLGGMFAVWNDHCGNGITVKDIHHRLMPAMQTLSAKCWTADGVTVPWEEFDYKRRYLSEAPGVNELGRVFAPGTRGTAAYPAPMLKGNTELDWIGPEVGYDYSVTFTLRADAVEKGTVLFEGPSSKVYLSSPEGGRLAFEREGYLNEFDYVVPKGQPVTLTVCGNHSETVLLVNGRFRQALYPLTVGSALADSGAAGATSDPYSASKMYYQRTLVFPLQRTGNFEGEISGLSVSNFIVDGAKGIRN